MKKPKRKKPPEKIALADAALWLYEAVEGSEAADIAAHVHRNFRGLSFYEHFVVNTAVAVFGVRAPSRNSRLIKGYRPDRHVRAGYDYDALDWMPELVVRDGRPGMDDMIYGKLSVNRKELRRIKKLFLSLNWAAGEET